MFPVVPSIRFKEHLNGHEPKEVLSPEEYEELRTLCRQSQKAERAEQAQEEERERPPGEEEPATPEGTDTVSCHPAASHSALTGFPCNETLIVSVLVRYK